MIVKIFFNTDGYIGAWAVNLFWKKHVNLISEQDIITAKKNNTAIIAEMRNDELVNFARMIDGRNGVEIIPEGGKFDIAFGTLKVKIHMDQDQLSRKLTREAHSFNQNKSDLEKTIYT